MFYCNWITVTGWIFLKNKNYNDNSDNDLQVASKIANTNSPPGKNYMPAELPGLYTCVFFTFLS